MHGLKRFSTFSPFVFAVRLALVFFTLQAVAAQGAATVVYVSPEGDESGPGTMEKPFRTIGRAVANLTADTHTVEITGGVYGEEDGESFPIHIPVGPGQRVILRGPASGKAIIRGRADAVVIAATILEGQLASPSEISMESLAFDNGLTGIAVDGQSRVDLTMRVRNCVFTDQKYQGLSASVGDQGTAAFIVDGNVFDGRPLYSLDLVVGRRASMQVQVEGNTIENTDPVGSSSTPPRAGIALHAEEGGRIQGFVDRNTIRNVSNGILVTQMPLKKEEAKVDLRISNCLVAGNPSPTSNHLENGFYFVLWPINENRLQLINNTVAHARGHGVLRAGGSSPGANWDPTTLSLVRSILWDVARGGFSDEQGAGLPSFYTEIRNNILPGGALVGSAGNISVDPLWGPRFEPGRESPAVDADAGAIPQEFVFDLMGKCRVADGNDDGVARIDLGAIERVGPCSGAVVFLRGDCDSSGALDLTDAVHHLNYLFLGGLEPQCPDACDANDDGVVDIADPIYCLGFMFTGGKAPAFPYPAWGEDPTEDRLPRCSGL